MAIQAQRAPCPSPTIVEPDIGCRGQRIVRKDIQRAGVVEILGSAADGICYRCVERAGAVECLVSASVSL